ncbi:MAG: helix-hairpin-helix domain-containing protein [Candidatus Omnitrophota bacterium]|nr:helix-hairpin-helix domain-containing protein [Candidatus Omnitrophota bacterium]
MFHLTSQEKKVLLIFLSVVLTGSVFHYSLQKYPFLTNIVNVIEGNHLYPKVDINRATQEELVALPFIGASSAQQIIRYRQDHGPLTSLEELKSIKGIKSKNFQRFAPYLKISQKRKVP